MIKPIYELIDDTIYVPVGCTCNSPNFFWGTPSELIFEGSNGIKVTGSVIEIDDNFIFDGGTWD